MDSKELRLCLAEAGVRGGGGVKALDELTHPSQDIFVVNADPIWRPGSHWMALYTPPLDQPMEFFDPLGKPPGPEIMNFIHTRSYLYQTQRLQNANTCGEFCLYYIMHRVRGRSLMDIISDFTRNTTLNDTIVTNFAQKYLSSYTHR